MPLSIVSSIHSAKYLPAYIGPEKVVYLVGGRMRVGLRLRLKLS
tara:strand:- start:890 stop:1021 length:132 start_codon:yes stop_codon:yes gene_type:complete